MEIQVRTDRQLRAGDELVSFIGLELLAGLGPCAGRVLAACVHLTTDWSAHDGPSLRCLLEVDPLGHAPLAVTHHAPTHDGAVQGAAGDMRGLLERMFRRIDARSTGEEPTGERTGEPTGERARPRPSADRRDGPHEGGGSWTSRFGPTTTSTVTKA